jgi:hypothetical protein
MSKQYKKRYNAICSLESPIGNLSLGDKVTGEANRMGETIKLDGLITKIVCYSDYFANHNRFTVDGEHGCGEIEVRDDRFLSGNGFEITLTKL